MGVVPIVNENDTVSVAVCCSFECLVWWPIINRASILTPNVS